MSEVVIMLKVIKKRTKNSLVAACVLVLMLSGFSQPVNEEKEVGENMAENFILDPDFELGAQMFAPGNL